MSLYKEGKVVVRKLSTVLFDFDGTLTQPGAIDFADIRQKIGCPEEMSILKFIDQMEGEEEQRKALSIVDDLEMTSALSSLPNEGAEEVVLYLKSRGVKLGIITRNGLKQVKKALLNFERLSWDDFDAVVTREDPGKPKPNRESVDLILNKLNSAYDEAILVGDYLYDIQAGNAAGLVTVLLDPEEEPQRWESWKCDYRISQIRELSDLLQTVLPISGGKLPNRFLGGYLEDLEQDDASLIIKPRVGEDTAAVDVHDEEMVVLKSDPITFVTESLGYYSLVVNSNDIATSGALPRWFLATLLFPPGSSPAEILEVMDELKAISDEMGITLCGGHTEITDAVTRPIVSGSLIGTVKKSELIDKTRIKPGDAILMTKGVAVEGTAIISSEFKDRLMELGCPEEDIAFGRQLQERISVIPEAKTVLRFKEGIHGLHDVTEGGLATAVEEFSRAGGHRFQVELANIPVFRQTRSICSVLKLDPLGLIGSGSLLICCDESVQSEVIRALQNENIETHAIGRVTDPGFGIEAIDQGRKISWPTFERDELTRLFE